MRAYNVSIALGLAVAAVFLLATKQCQAQGSVPGPSQQNIGSNTQGSRTLPLASDGDQVRKSFCLVFELFPAFSTAPTL